MKVLLLGSGAAMHALAWKVVSAPHVEELHCAPGNAGTALMLGNPPFSSTYGADIAQWAFAQQVDLVVVQGNPAWTEMLAGVGLPVLGVGEAGAAVLGYRQALRERLQATPVHLPEARSFCDPASAERYLASRRLPLWICPEDTGQHRAVRVEERLDAFHELSRLLSLDPQHGVSIEADVPGVEVGLGLLTDGQRVISLGVSRPYDRRYDGDAGPLTEGMGAYAPYEVPATPGLEERLLAEVGRPVVEALSSAGLLRPTFLYLRIILNHEGAVLRRLSARFDDLHMAVTAPRWGGDVAGLLAAAAQGRLAERAPCWTPGVAVAVTMAVEGYPDPSPQGQPLPEEYETDALVFHHATRMAPGEAQRPFSWLIATPTTGREPRPPTSLVAGGRPLVVVGFAASGSEARQKAYHGVAQLTFTHSSCRTDIGAELE